MTFASSQTVNDKLKVDAMSSDFFSLKTGYVSDLQNEYVDQLKQVAGVTSNYVQSDLVCEELHDFLKSHETQ